MLRPDPGRQRVAVGDRERPRQPGAERRLREPPADRRAAHAGDDHPPGASTGAIAGRVHAPHARRAGAPARSPISAAWPVESTAATASRSSGAARRRPPSEPDRPVGERARPGRSARRWRRCCRRRASTPSPSTLSPSTWQSSPIRDARRRRCSRSARSRSPIVAPSSTTARSTVVPRADRDVALEHDAAADPRAARRSGSRTRPAPTGRSARRSRRRPRRTGSARPSAPATSVADRALEDVEGALQVAVGRPDVHPVALADVAVEPVADQPREHVALDRGGLARAASRSSTERSSTYAPAEMLLVSIWSADGFSTNSVTCVVGRQPHEPVGGRVLDRRQRERRARAGRLVLARSARSGRGRSARRR